MTRCTDGYRNFVSIESDEDQISWQKDLFNIISIIEENNLLLVKLRIGDDFKIYLFENITRQQFIENERYIDFNIRRNIKYCPIAEFCNGPKGWLMGQIMLREL